MLAAVGKLKSTLARLARLLGSELAVARREEREAVSAESHQLPRWSQGPDMFRRLTQTLNHRGLSLPMRVLHPRACGWKTCSSFGLAKIEQAVLRNLPDILPSLGDQSLESVEPT
jgi:hypothetical protein